MIVITHISQILVLLYIECTEILTKVRRIYNQYISGCIIVTKMSQVSPESLIKDILFEGISIVVDRHTEPHRGHV